MKLHVSAHVQNSRHWAVANVLFCDYFYYVQNLNKLNWFGKIKNPAFYTVISIATLK